MLAVGDSTKLEIIFNTGSYRGIQSKSPVITTNEGPQKVTAKIMANIYTNPDSTYPLTIAPSKVDFPDTGESIVTEFYLSLVNKSKQPLRPKLISLPKALVSVTLPSTIQAGGSADLSIKLKDAALNKTFEKSLTFELNDADHTRFTIPIKRGTVVPPAKGKAGH